MNHDVDCRVVEFVFYHDDTADHDVISSSKLMKMALVYPELFKSIYDCAFEVHRCLGPGLLESAYEACLEKELKDAGLIIERQKNMPVPYKGLFLEVGYRLDLYVEQKVILELKAVEEIRPLHIAQLMTYMKLADCRLGFLINFNVLLLKDGIKRYVL